MHINLGLVSLENYSSVASSLHLSKLHSRRNIYQFDSQKCY